MRKDWPVNDKSRPLVIDPTLVYAAWFSQIVTLSAMARDTQGNMYVGGTASSLAGANVEGAVVNFSPFVIKFDPTGSTVLYATFVGGTSGDTLNALTVDSTGNVVAIGYTQSKDFPVVNPTQTCSNGATCGFVFRLNPSGNGLVFSTYTAGSSPYGYVTGNAVAVDSAGNAYVTLETFSQKFLPDGTVGYTSTLASGNAITVDQQGYAYIAGTGLASAFAAIPGARDVTGSQCVYVAKLSPDGASVVWATLLGGSGTQTPNAIVRDPASGIVYIAGQTTSTDLPVTPGVIQPVSHGEYDGFIASVNADGSAFGFVTYLGGFSSDEIYAMALTTAGQIVVAGDTTSPDFPTRNAVQSTIGGNGVSLLVTTDYGNSWTAEGSGLSFDGLRGFSVDPTNPSNIVAATSVGLFRSTNGGVSWSQRTPGWIVFNGPASRSLADPEVLYALSSDEWLYRSDDGGASWTARAFVPECVAVVASPTDPNTVIVFGFDGSLNISTDGGESFPFPPPHLATPDTPIASPDGSIYLPIAGNSYNGVAGGSILKSTDNGNTWQLLVGSPYALAAYAPSICTADPSVLFVVSNSSFLYRSNDAGVSWTLLNYVANSVAVAPSNCQVVYEASSDRPGVRVSKDGGNTWSSAAGLTSAVFTGIAVDPKNPAHVWVAPEIDSDGFVAKISNDGTTLLWSTFYGGSGWEEIRGVVIDNAGNAWIAADSGSNDLPLTTDHPSAWQGNVLVLGEISDATAACSYQLIPWSAISYAAGMVNFAVTAPSGCAWTATPSDNWITTVNPPSGTASASVAALVAANTTNVTRSGTILVGNQRFIITQPSASCNYSIDNSSFVLPAAGGQVVVSIRTGDGCPWNVIPGGLTIVFGASGTGNGAAWLSAPPNKTLHSREFVAKVGPYMVTVTVAEACTYSLSPLTIDGPISNPQILITASNSACEWNLSTTSTWMTPSNSSGTGSENLVFYASTNRTGAARTAVVAIGSQTFTVTQAVDTLPQYTVSVVVQPSGAGTAGPSETADVGSLICLNESPAPGWVFTSWSGVDLTSGSSCFTLSGDTNVTANFSTNAQFNDVSPSATYSDAVNLMFQTGVTTGCVIGASPSTRSFCPDDNVTREEMAAFIVRAVTGTATPAMYNPTPYFSDVPPSDPFFPHVQKLMDLGITTGCAANLFCPNDTIPRWEMAIFMVRARLMLHAASFTYRPTPYFADVGANVEGNGQAFPFIQRSYEENITAGCGTSPLVYCPDEIVTRWQMASFIMRALFNQVMAAPANAPMLTGVSPSVMTATPGEQLTTTIIGVNTNFQAGDTVTVPSGMLTVSDVIVTSATSITVTLIEAANIVAGPQALVVNSGGQNLTLPLAIKVGTY